MKWMRERDLLIAQTMAFVQSVAGRKPEAAVFARPDIAPVTPTRLPDVEAMLAEALGDAGAQLVALGLELEPAEPREAAQRHLEAAVKAGVSRSTAAAYIAACALNPGGDQAERRADAVRPLVH